VKTPSGLSLPCACPEPAMVNVRFSARKV
jgi:hypothetical protein